MRNLIINRPVPFVADSVCPFQTGWLSVRFVNISHVYPKTP